MQAAKGLIMARSLEDIIKHLRGVAGDMSVSGTLIQTEDVIVLCDAAERGARHELSDNQKELLRAVAYGLQGRRNRYGKIEPAPFDRVRLRKAGEALGYLARLPHGGLDFADKAAMLLQCMCDDTPLSMFDRK